MKFKIFNLICCLLLCAACSGRLPAQARTKRIIRHHFSDYGKDYKSSPFGGKKVENVEILKMEEIHKHLLAVTSFITLSGPEVFKVRIVIEKGPFGWRFVAWENLSGG